MGASGQPRSAVVAVLVGLGAVALAVAMPGVSTAATPVPAGILSGVAGGAGAGDPTGISISPSGLVVGPGGFVYIADDEGYVRALTPAGHESTWAGSGLAGATVDGATATGSTLLDTDPAYLDGDTSPMGEAMDRSRDIIVADSALGTVRIIAWSTGIRYGISMTGRHVYTLAGRSGDNAAFSGDGGPGPEATLSGPSGVAVDGAGDVVIADTNDHEIQFIPALTSTHFGIAMTAGHIYTVAGTGTAGGAGLGGIGTAAELSAPAGVAVTANGSVVVADSGTNQVDVLAAASGRFYGVNMAAGRLYAVVGTGAQGSRGDGGKAITAQLDQPQGVAVDSAGDLLIADTANHEIRAVGAASTTMFGVKVAQSAIATIAGTGVAGAGGASGAATTAGLEDPQAVAVDHHGNLLIADTARETVMLVAARSGTWYGRPMHASDVYAVAGNGRFSSSGNGSAAPAGELNDPLGVSVAPNGDMAFATYGTAGLPSSLSGDLSFGDGAARIVVVAAGNETRFGRRLSAGDLTTVAGGQATEVAPTSGGLGTARALDGPAGAVWDHAGNLVISESGPGLIDVLAATTGRFYGRAMTAGDIYIVAGGGAGSALSGVPATSTQFDGVEQVAVDAFGNLVFPVLSGEVEVLVSRDAYFYHQSVTAGDVYTIAGNGSTTDSGDGGAATAAGIGDPVGVAIDRSGDVAFSDFDGSMADAGSVRLVVETAGPHFGRSAGVGDIVTIAGGGSPTTNLGNGGPALSSALVGPEGLAFTPDGSLVVADAGASELRLVAPTSASRYGLATTAGDIYSMAGTGTLGAPVLGSAATTSELGAPYGVAVTANGSVVFTDELDGTIDEVAVG